MSIKHNKKNVQITLTHEQFNGLVDMVAEWRLWSCPAWMDRDDCENWKRSPIARENRRETITMGNMVSSIRAILGREIVQLADEQNKKDQGSRRYRR